MTGDHNQRVLDALLRRMDADKKGTNHAGGNGHAISPTATTDTVPDETIIEKMRGAANAPKFATLFDDGDIRAYDDDESSADLALLSILAFYTQDVVQLDRLYRSSALMRPKWERYDYRKRTIEEALADLDETFDWTRVCATKDTDFVSSKIMTDLLDETNSDSSTSPRTHGPEEGSLPFKTAREIAETTPEKTSWVCYPWFAQATITEISGPIKKAGKTTFAAHACRNILDGASFMGGATKKTGVAYLTEQAPNSFRKVVTDAGLEARKDFHVLYWQDVRGFEWSDLMRRICDQAEELGVGLIVVDVLSRWVGGTEDENSATYALNAMTPLKEATARGLTVVYLRHDRKSGGDVGESGRGTSQVGGDADQLLQINRPRGGNNRPTVRKIGALGRFMDETPEETTIELCPKNNEYRRLGSGADFAKQTAMQAVVDVLPATPENALISRDVVTRAVERGAARTQVYKALDVLHDAETIIRLGEGKKGDSYRYYKPDPEGKSYSSKTPNYTDETKNEKQEATSLLGDEATLEETSQTSATSPRGEEGEEIEGAL